MILTFNYNYTLNGKTVHATVDVDSGDKLELLVRKLTHKALESKNLTASAAEGVITVKVEVDP